jgi:hypothetical protein
VVGRVTLGLEAGGSIPGITLSGQFLLEVNTYSTAVTIKTFQTKLDTGEVSATSPEAGLLATDSDTGFITIGPVTIENGLRIVLQGELVLGDPDNPLVEIRGRFEFTFRTEPSFLIEVKVFAMASLLGIGEFEIDSVLQIDSTGLAAYISVSIGVGASFGGGIGLGFSVTGVLEINTSSTTKVLSTP